MQTRNSADTALGFALAGLVIAFVVSLTWVAQLSDWLRSLQVVSFVIAVYVVSTIMQTRAERRMDEVELAAARFGARWGLVIGIALLVILILLPPSQNFLVGFASSLESAEANTLPGDVQMFLLGIVSAMVAQEASRFVLVAGWKWSKH
jgi:uncharacterized membrane protein